MRDPSEIGGAGKHEMREGVPRMPPRSRCSRSAPSVSALASKNPLLCVALHVVVDYDPEIQLVVVRT
jgi:hypothetical protein